MNSSSVAQNNARDAKSSGKRSKHTPGPWLWQHSGDGDGNYTVWTRQPHTGELAQVQCEDINGKFPAKANAVLMAAAPDLLEALREALAFIDRVEGHGYGGTSEHICAQWAARDAIAKATGEPSPAATASPAAGSVSHREEHK